MIRSALTAAAAAALMGACCSALGADLKGTEMHPVERAADVKLAAMLEINRRAAAAASAPLGTVVVETADGHALGVADNIARELADFNAHRASLTLARVRQLETAGLLIGYLTAAPTPGVHLTAAGHAVIEQRERDRA